MLLQIMSFKLIHSFLFENKCYFTLQFYKQVILKNQFNYLFLMGKNVLSYIADKAEFLFESHWEVSFISGLSYSVPIPCSSGLHTTNLILNKWKTDVWAQSKRCILTGYVAKRFENQIYCERLQLLNFLWTTHFQSIVSRDGWHIHWSHEFLLRL